MAVRDRLQVVRRLTLPLLLAMGGGMAAAEIPLTLQGVGPYYRLLLPANVFPYSGHADLRDLQVLNAGGTPVPYAWVSGEPGVEALRSQRVPLFAVPAPTPAQPDNAAALTLRIGRDGQLQLAATRPGSVQPAEGGDWILDASAVKGSMAQLRLEFAPGRNGFFDYTLQVGDDLQHWRTVTVRGPLARLQADGAQIERLAVDLQGVRERYLRLQFRNPATVPLLLAAHVDSVQRAEQVPVLQWSVAFKPARCDVQSCDYELPANTPIDSLRITLSQSNTLSPVMVSGLRPPATFAPAPAYHPHRNPLYLLRHKRERALAPPQTGQHWLASTVAYRLSAAGGPEDVSAPDLPLGGGVYAGLRLAWQVPVQRLGAEPPSVAIGSYPRTLVFLAQGSGPFRLAWSADSASTVLPLRTLMPGYKAGQALAADEARLDMPLAKVEPAGVAPVSAPKESTGPSRPLWLWATLGLVLLLLAGMAWSLLRSLRQAS